MLAIGRGLRDSSRYPASFVVSKIPSQYIMLLPAVLTYEWFDNNMSFNRTNPSSSSFHQHESFPVYGASLDHNPPIPQFDIAAWYPQFLSCHRYFLDHAQHSGACQAMAAFINIKLPYQKSTDPIMSSTSSSPRGAALNLQPSPFAQTPVASSHPIAVSLTPYIRRLIATGQDTDGVLHGFFGDDYKRGIGSLHEIERRNYLFAAKSTSWMKVKQAYDMSAEETCPFLSPLRDATEAEIQAAESTWSEWLAMQDWMLGSRSPEAMKSGRSPQVKREQD